MTPILPRLLPLVDAARYCGLPAPTFKRLSQEGILPTALRLGRSPLWDRTAIDEALDRLKAVAVPPPDSAALTRAATPEEIALLRIQNLRGGD